METAEPWEFRLVDCAIFLTEEEKQFAVDRLRIKYSTAYAENIPNDQEETGDTKSENNPNTTVEVVQDEEEQFEWREIIRGLTSIQAWITGIAYLGLVVCLYSFSLFLPTIIAGLGFSGTQAQLHTVPPYVPATVLTVMVAFLSDHVKLRAPFILCCLPLSIIGYVISITVTSTAARYGAVFLIAAGVYSSIPCILCLMPNNSGGYYKKATSVALQLALANSGGFIATFIYTDDQKPRYVRGHTITLSMIVLAWFLIATNMLYCIWENKARREGRRDGNIARWQKLRDEGKTRAPLGDRDPRFIFTL